MSEEQPMRKVIFAINITIDGYCDIDRKNNFSHWLFF